MNEGINQQHRSAKSILAFRKAERKKDAMAYAQIAYDVYKEKKRREKSIIISGQNSAKQPKNN